MFFSNYQPIFMFFLKYIKIVQHLIKNYNLSMH